MAKKKTRAARQSTLSIPRRLVEGLREAELLAERKHWTEARDQLEALDQRFPGQPDLLTQLVNVYFELQDTRGYLYACERLLKVDPDDAAAMTGLAGAYMDNLWLALARRTFRRFLQRWPDHPRAVEVGRTLLELERDLEAWLAHEGLSGEDGLQFAARHEEVQVYLSQGRHALARRAAEALLQQRPTFAPALNNLSLAYYTEGQLDLALAAAQRVVAFDPENVHALANLARYLCLKGQADEARPWVAQLRVSPAPAAERSLKVAEALSYLGDDAGVLEVFQQAEQSGESMPAGSQATFSHLAAVAALRLGQTSAAHRYWQQALNLRPGHDLTQANLDNLRRPAEEQYAPWPFSWSDWVSPAVIADMRRLLTPAAKDRNSESTVTHAARRFLQQHPEMTPLAPRLLERGDPASVDFVLMLAKMAETPEWLALLKDFALGQRGPDKKRVEAAQLAAQAGLLPRSHVRLWLKGKWTEMLLMGFEIHGEAVAQPHSPRVDRWLQEAVLALQDDQPERAEHLLKRALEQEPDVPDLLNNLAGAYNMQGRNAEAEAITQQIFERRPDYLFARTNLATLAALRGETEKAKQLLEPVYARRQMHFSELAAFCGANIEITLAEKNLEAARSWIKMWEAADPQNPNLAHYRSRVGEAHLGGRRS